MKHSSRRDPCPVCKRDTDDKCRWTSSAIFCFYGDSFHPSNSLNLGDRVFAFDGEWQLVKLQGGFSGGSYVFLRVAEVQRFREFTKEQRASYRQESALIQQRANRRFLRLRKNVKDCFALRDLHSMQCEQLKRAAELLSSTLEECSTLYTYVCENKYRIEFSNTKVAAISIWGKRISYQASDVHIFIRDYLMG